MKRIGITIGDPSGIGPELVVAVLAAAPEELRARVVVYGDAGVLARAGGLAPGVALVAVTNLAADDACPGRPTVAGGAAQVAYLEAAVRDASAGALAALVTAPISKQQVTRAGFAFPGHTEFLAARLGADEHAMAFIGPRLRVVLATIHLPLAEVPRRLSAEAIARAIFLVGRSLVHDLGVARPRHGVLGLNPHAGEGGLFGDEEARLVVPGIAQGRARLAAAALPATVHGPLVPDAAFRDALHPPTGVGTGRADQPDQPDQPAKPAKFDALVALYHDQGLIPVKLVDFDEAVNVTLGLPIVRTSPDHGVAYDIAGTGIVPGTGVVPGTGTSSGRIRTTSFAAALALADRMTRTATATIR